MDDPLEMFSVVTSEHSTSYYREPHSVTFIVATLIIAQTGNSLVIRQLMNA